MLHVAVFSLLLPAFAEQAAIEQVAVREDEPKIRVSLSDSRLERGDRALVYVRTEKDGYLIVMHADPDGRVRVLFPLDPGDDDFIRGGERHEIRGRGGRNAITVEPRRGRGTVYAALSSNPFRFDQFVRGDHWDYRVLGDSTVALDAEGGLTDIVQRMTADGHFDYDLVTYDITERIASSPSWLYDRWSHSHWYDAWYDPYWGLHRSPFGLGFGLAFRASRPRFHFRYGYSDRFFYDPYFYDPYFYDPLHCDPYFCGYGRGFGFPRSITYVYVNHPRSGYSRDWPYRRYTFKGGDRFTGGGVGIEYRRPSSTLADRRFSSPTSPTPRAPNDGNVTVFRRRPSNAESVLELDGRSSRRVLPAPDRPSQEGQARRIEPRRREPLEDEPRRTEPRLREPRRAEPRSVEPRVIEPRRSEPRSADTRASELRRSEPRRAEPGESEPRRLEPRSEEPRVIEPRRSEPRTSEPRGIERQRVEPRRAEPRAIEPQRAEPRSAEPRGYHPRRAESLAGSERPSAIYRDSRRGEGTSIRSAPPRSDGAVQRAGGSRRRP